MGASLGCPCRFGATLISRGSGDAEVLSRSGDYHEARKVGEDAIATHSILAADLQTGIARRGGQTIACSRARSADRACVRAGGDGAGRVQIRICRD